MVHTYIRLMAEILPRQLCVIYESSGCSPYDPLISRHERWCRNVKMKGVHRNNSSSRLVQDFGHHTCFFAVFPLLYFLLYKTTSKQQFVAVEFWSKSLGRCFLNGGSNFIWPGRYWLAASLMTTRWLSHVTLFWVFSIIFFLSGGNKNPAQHLGGDKNLAFLAGLPWSWKRKGMTWYLFPDGIGMGERMRLDTSWGAVGA